MALVGGISYAKAGGNTCILRTSHAPPSNEIFSLLLMKQNQANKEQANDDLLPNQKRRKEEEEKPRERRQTRQKHRELNLYNFRSELRSTQLRASRATSKKENKAELNKQEILV